MRVNVIVQFVEQHLLWARKYLTCDDPNGVETAWLRREKEALLENAEALKTARSPTQVDTTTEKLGMKTWQCSLHEREDNAVEGNRIQYWRRIVSPARDLIGQITQYVTEPSTPL